MRIRLAGATMIMAAAMSLSQALDRNDYARPENWLCRPGTSGDACTVDLTTTVVDAEGKTTRESFVANPNPPIDCFYVYPTVSSDQTPNSDMSIDPAERNVVRQQFARFASHCRAFAPMYRQVTVSGLRAVLGGGKTLDQAPAYTDVLDAWHHYLKNDNNGRGVVLIGHSQGAAILMKLIADEVDGKPIQQQLVSAMLMGWTVPVPKGKDVGGAFKSIPLCRTAEQVGCVISFVSFRSTMPPPANTLFGRVAAEGLEAACTNPAALSGGPGPLRAYLTGQGSLIASATTLKHEWVKGAAPVATPFVSVPGLLTAECAANEHANFLKITVNADPADPRADDIPGDVAMLGKPQTNWGLHLIDVNLAMGNLLDIVASQAKAYLKGG